MFKFFNKFKKANLENNCGTNEVHDEVTVENSTDISEQNNTIVSEQSNAVATSNISEEENEKNREEIMKKTNEIMQQVTNDAFARQPMFIKVRYLLSQISRIAANENSSVEDIEYKINFAEINRLLNLNDGSNEKKFDFNVFDEIKSVKNLYELDSDITMASLDMEPWYKYTCKKCGKTEYLFYRDIQFYKSKGFDAPKVCKKCREQNKLTYGGAKTPIENIFEKIANGCFIKISNNSSVIYDGPISDKIKKKYSGYTVNKMRKEKNKTIITVN